CFFGTLKSECFYLDEFSNISELKDAVTEYIEYYNSRRISLKLGNDSNLLIVFYVQIMPDDFVMQLHRF
ncbi:IS3 family transposase, partial [Escherichia coli]